MSARRWAIVALALLSGCGRPPSFARQFAESIEDAHGLHAWRAKSAIEAQLRVEFQGQVAIDGRMLYEPRRGRSRMELKDGTVLGFDGREAWVSPASSSFERARFHLMLWPYVLAVPMKLRDPGVRLASLGRLELDRRPYPAAKMTFAPGTGDTPKDWYVVFQEPDTHRLYALAWLSTYGTSLAEASKQPRLITYHNVETIEGVTLARTWVFWHWSLERGMSGEPLGSATLSSIRFVTPTPNAFTKPANARIDPLPTSGS